MQQKYFLIVVFFVILIILIVYQREDLYSYSHSFKTLISNQATSNKFQKNWIYPNDDEELLKKKSPSIFCLIKTHPNNIKINKTLNVYRVWARKCDNYRFVTLLPQHLRPINPKDTVEVFENFYMIQPKGLVSENHGNLTLKLYYSMIYVYKNLPQYDWYYIVDDDAYVNVYNLKQFLRDKPSNQSITYGYNFKVIVKGGYHSGGPGYVLSKNAFTTITKAMIDKVSNCPNTGVDDVDINACVRKYNGTKGKSVDKNGRERFLVVNLMAHFTGSTGKWLNYYAENPPQKGLNCCADSIIAVHYMSPRDVFRLDLAIEVQKNILKVYDDYLKINKSISFKNIIKNYILLQDIESDSNKYKELIDF